VNGFNANNGATLYLEIGQGALRVLKGESGLEIPLERLENGRLTEPCKERVAAALRNFLKRPAWQPRLRALCAINARGVSLRQITLPVASGDELRRLLLLQIESEFPMAPEELVWGYRQLETKAQVVSGTGGRQTLLVAAVKKEVLEQYSGLLTSCGISAVFTLAALARGFLCSPLHGSYAMLDIGRSQAELTIFENNAAVSVRVLQWGAEHFSEPGTSGQFIDSLVTALRNNRNVRKVYLTGEGVRDAAAARRMAGALEVLADCERIETPSGVGHSATMAGLKKAVERDGGASLLTMQAKEAVAGRGGMQPAMAKWIARAAALLVLVLVFPYLEALIMKPRLARKISDLENSRDRLTTIDREWSFLQYLKKNQPPYLDAVYLMANAAAKGARFDSISMNRRGDVSFKGTMQNSQQVADFRAKLINSGFYSNVVVEEQTPPPQPFEQKVTLRISAQWKSEAAREALTLGPSTDEFEKLRMAAKEAHFAQPPPMMGNPFPFPMPSAAPPPMAGPPGPSARPVVRSPTAGGRRVIMPPGATRPIVIPGPDDQQ
jgi:hypothetical protein